MPGEIAYGSLRLRLHLLDLNFLRALFRRAEPVELVLYSRPDCRLCEELKAELGRAKPSRPVQLREVNIAGDAELEERYGLSIPVLEIAGRVAFKGRMTASEFERKFDRLTKGSS